jgi:hypothetical protein
MLRGWFMVIVAVFAKWLIAQVKGLALMRVVMADLMFVVS